jgi:predicted Zn-dependent protease
MLEIEHYDSRPRFAKAAMHRATAIAVLVATVCLGACETSPTGRSQLMLVSEQQAIDASKAAYFETIAPLEKQGKVDNNPKLKKRVQRITGRLVAQAIEMRPDSRKWEWSIKVIDEPDVVNAWAMAGGRMAIYTGLIYKIDPSDDELAQVLGHEIAHALANHTAEKMSVAMASQIGVMAVGVASDNSGVALSGAALAATVAVGLPNSRAAESEADEIGMELAARAGYDPRAAISLWDKMGRAGDGQRPPDFLSTHPSPDSRMTELARLVPRMMPYYEEGGKRPTYKL